MKIKDIPHDYSCYNCERPAAEHDWTVDGETGEFTSIGKCDDVLVDCPGFELDPSDRECLLIDDVTVKAEVEQWQKFMNVINMYPAQWCDHTWLIFEEEFADVNPFLCLWKCGRVLDQKEFFELGALTSESFILKGHHVVEAMKVAGALEEMAKEEENATFSYYEPYSRHGIILGDKAIEEVIKKAVGQPVWDHPTEKNRRIGTVIRAERDDKRKGIRMTMQMDNPMTHEKMKKSIEGMEKVIK